MYGRAAFCFLSCRTELLDESSFLYKLQLTIELSLGFEFPSFAVLPGSVMLSLGMPFVMESL